MKTLARGSARRYARALLDVALEAGTADTLRAPLQQAATLLAGNAELAQALAHPGIPAAAKKRVLAAVWPGATELLRRLLEMLVERGRTELLPAIASEFAALHNQTRGVVAAELVTARPLPAAEREPLTRAVRELAGQEVEVSERVAPELIGGVVLKLGGRVYDGSVRTRLKALQRRLSGPA